MNDYHRKILAKADWPFLHRERVMTTFAPSSTFTAVAGTDVCTAASTIMTATGTEVEFSSTTTLPAGLSASTTYYLIYQSATTFKVATSLANALAGTVVDVTDTGTGTHTVTVKSRYQALPYDADLIEAVSVDVSDVIHTPKHAPNKAFWNNLLYTDQQSDTPEYWYSENGKFALWPRPATSGNVITLTCKIRVMDLNVANYTTGTVDIATNGSIAITGSGTSWTAPMAGRWIRITHSDTAASSGDGQWYEITSVPSTTTLTLSRPYGGRSLTTGASAAYIIGQMPLLPEAFHDLPEQYAAYRYWSKEKDERAAGFKQMVQEGVADLFTSYGFNDLSMVIDDGDDHAILNNPNLYPSAPQEAP